MSTVASFDPRTGAVARSAPVTGGARLTAVVEKAQAAAPPTAAVSPATRRAWLHALAAAVEGHAGELVPLADAETGLGTERLSQEIARTAGQLRFYGDIAAEGSYLDATIDTVEASGVNLARVNHPLGPVAVFGASNFPFAFGVLGNDTASALAAGCPVVVKAHDAHIGLSCRLADIASSALRACGAPEGVFGLVVGFEAGVELVKQPGIAAVGFTGSQAGGLALWRIANERDVVIPVYAEMGTVNPVVVTPAAGREMTSIAEGFVGSFTLGSGQYCTKPGLMFAPRGAGAPAAVAAAVGAAPEPLMLTRRIAESLRSGVEALQAAGARLVRSVAGTAGGWAGTVAVLTAPIEAIRPGSRLLEECFGPVAVVVEYDHLDQVRTALTAMRGALAASVITGGDDDPDAAALVSRLAGKVGRVCLNQWPTGVACTWAQHHGGPWPATSSPPSTSVGAAALRRWVRPVAYQGMPDSLLPAPLRRDNPWGIPRRIDGRPAGAGVAS